MELYTGSNALDYVTEWGWAPMFWFITSNFVSLLWPRHDAVFIVIWRSARHGRAVAPETNSTVGVAHARVGLAHTAVCLHHATVGLAHAAVGVAHTPQSGCRT